MAKRLDASWVVIDKRRSVDHPDREFHRVDAVFVDKRAAYQHLDNIDATDYDRHLRDVVVVPFDVFYEAPDFLDLWQIDHESSDTRAAVPQEVRVFEHTDPKWFRPDARLPAVSEPDDENRALVVTAKTHDACLAAFVEAAALHGVEYYKPPRRMPGALPSGQR